METMFQIEKAKDLAEKVKVQTLEEDIEMFKAFDINHALAVKNVLIKYGEEHSVENTFYFSEKHGKYVSDSVSDDIYLEDVEEFVTQFRFVATDMIRVKARCEEFGDDFIRLAQQYLIQKEAGQMDKDYWDFINEELDKLEKAQIKANLEAQGVTFDELI